MSQRNLLNASITFGAMLAAISAPAIAQDAEPLSQPAETPVEAPAETEESASRRMEAIIVSARKKDENLQTVPIAVSAFNEAMIEKTFATRLDDIKGIPNVVLDEAPAFRNTASFYIRGMGYQDIDLTFEPAVGVVLDGVFLSKANGSLLDVFDLGSIEILRGPQGTLFGKNTMAGVVNVTTKNPSGEFGLEARARIGNYGRNDYRIAVEAPLGDRFAFRLSGLSNSSDGYAEDIATGDSLGGDDLTAGRLVVTGDPTDSFKIKFTADVSRDRGDTSAINNTSINLPEPTPLQNALPLLGFPADTDGDLLRVNSGIRGPYAVDSQGVSLQMDWTIGDFVVTSITGWRDQEEETFVDVDGEAAALFELPRVADFSQLTQELRIAGTLGERADFVAGVNYTGAEHNQNLGFTIDCNLLGFPGCPAPGVVGTTVETPQYQEVASLGVFAQGNYRLTDKLRITGGIRYSSDEKDYTYTESNIANNNLGPLQGLSLASLLANAPAPAQTGQFNVTFDDVTWRVGADYEFTQDIFGYASVATGFKAGGFNGRANTFAQVGPYDPETVTTYETGLKTQLFDNRVRFNSAVFFNDYKDLQVEVLQIQGGSNVTLVTNASNAKIWGVEMEGTALLTDNLTGNLSIGYLNAEYDGFEADLFSRGFSTNNDFLELRRAPELTLGAGLDYEQELGSGGAILWSGGVSYVSDYETNVQNYDFGRHEAETLLNASVRYTTPGERFEITLWGRNLTDEVRVSSSNPIPPFSSFNQGTSPMTYGIELGMRY